MIRRLRRSLRHFTYRVLLQVYIGLCSAINWNALQTKGSDRSERKRSSSWNRLRELCNNVIHHRPFDAFDLQEGGQKAVRRMYMQWKPHSC